MKAIAQLLVICFVLSSAHADCVFTNANVVYVSPNGDDSTAIPGCPDKPFFDPVVANSKATNNWTLIFLPGNYNLSNCIALHKGQNVQISVGASLTNWISNAGAVPLLPLFYVSDNSTIVLEGAITDGVGHGSPTIESCAIGLLPETPPGGYGAATNVLVTGHGWIYGSSECISFEAENVCSGRIEHVHVSAYHSAINFVRGPHTFVLDNVTATLLPSPAWQTNAQNDLNRVVYLYPYISSVTNNITIKNSHLISLVPETPCIYFVNSNDEFTLVNTDLINDGTASAIMIYPRSTLSAYRPTITSAFGSVVPRDISPIQVFHPLFKKADIQYKLKISPPYPVLPQVTNNYTLPSLGASNMIFYNMNGVPTVAWSLGSTATYSAPLLLGTITTNAPGSQ